MMTLMRFLQSVPKLSVLPRIFTAHRDHEPRQGFASYAGSYYDILELTPHASQTQIKSAYYRLSKKYHPDVASEQHDAKEKFAKLSMAYEVLGNPRTRRLYDSGALGIGGVSVPEDGPSVEVEYREFIHRRGSFRPRHSGHTPTGRSPMFDFDEFYRQHYGDSVRKTQQSRVNKSQLDKEEERHRFQMNRNLFVYGATIVMSVVVMMLTGRGRFR
jgi:DnaJ family protein C protein 30